MHHKGHTKNLGTSIMQVTETPATGNFISVTIYRIPGTPQTVVLNGDRTIPVALDVAGLSMDESMEAHVGTQTLSYTEVNTAGSHELDEGDIVQIVSKTKGN
jgi:hypothetical protein